MISYQRYRATQDAMVTQKAFSVLLHAMARPGRIYNLNIHFQHQSFSCSAFHLILLSLLDHEAGFSVIGEGKETIESWIRQYTRSHPMDIRKADFIIVTNGRSEGEILKAKRGSLGYPDHGATVIYIVESLKGYGNGASFVLLRGPGIKDSLSILINGLDKDEIYYIREINAEFPFGIDCIFIDKSDRIACIPRSTRIEVN